MKTILILEDETIMLNLLQKQLKADGYDVRAAEDGETGLAMMKEIKPDLVLLDIIMPKKDGFEVLEEKRRDKTIKDIPVIIISNSGQPVELTRAQSFGVVDWLIKTEFDPQEVKVKVKKQIG
ncbi:MAG: response regulator [Candidatus Pacebacteria bacterium]|nr:response regulator [Candidatus Paceibacterota bacterium]